jgi:hypothetical protein
MLMKNQTEFIRTEKKSNFSVVSNSIIDSTDFTSDESILLIYLLHLPDTWKIYKSHIQKLFKEKQMTKSRFEKGWKGLIEKGHLIRSRNRGESGQFNSWSYTIVESPSPEVSKTDKSVIQPSVNREVSKPTSRELDDIIKTNKESTNRIKKKEYNTKELYNILGQLEGEVKHLTTARLNYLKSRYPEYPQLLNIHTLEEIDRLDNWVPELKLDDIKNNVSYISSKLLPIINQTSI